MPASRDFIVTTGIILMGIKCSDESKMGDDWI